MNDSQPRYVLDSFALLAYLEGEPGAARVQAILSLARDGSAEAILSVVNYGEILYIVERERGLPAAQKAIAAIDQLPLEVVDADRELAFAAAHVKATHPIAYADAFAVALAQARGASVITGDPEFQHVGQLITVEWLAEENLTS